MAIEDRRSLISFTKSLRGVVISVVLEPSSLIRPPMLQLFRNAWPEIEAAFLSVTAQLDDANIDERLVDVGLTGSQLTLKTSGYQRALERWLRKPARGALRRLLEWADTILDSLVSVLPAVEVVREYKECIMNEVHSEPA